MKHLLKNKRELLLIIILVISVIIINCFSMLKLYHEKKKVVETELTNKVLEQKILIVKLNIEFKDEQKIIKILVNDISSNYQFSIVKVSDSTTHILLSSKNEIETDLLTNTQLNKTQEVEFSKYKDKNNKTSQIFYTYIFDLNWYVVYQIHEINLIKPYIKTFIISSIIAILVLSLASFLLLKILNLFNKDVVDTQKRFMNIVKNTEAAYFFINKEGIVIEINKAFLKLYKYDNENEVLGKNIADIQRNQKKEAVENFINQILENNPNFLSGEFERINKDNTTGFNSFSVRPVTSQGEIIGIEGFLIDITQIKLNEKNITENQAILKKQNEEYETINSELKQTNTELIIAKEEIEKNEKRFKNYLENAPDGIFVTDRKGNYIGVNPAAVKLTGYSEEELLTKNIKDLVASDHLERGLQHFNTLLKVGKSINDIKFVKKDGTEYYMEVSAVKLSENEFIGFCKDTTNRKKTEELLLKKNNEIASQNEEYKQINEELFVAKQKAEESMLLKSAFLQNISHEVRTPMNSIIGFSQLLTKPNLSHEKITLFNEKITISCENLLNIITDIIEISQIETSKVLINEAEFNIIEMINTVYDNVKNRYREKNINFNLNINTNLKELYIKGDKYKIYKIIFHLLDNAVKFTPEGVVKLDCFVSDSTLNFKVSDTGIGISSDKQQLIFEPFRQIEIGTTRKFGGNGIGLSIVKKYTEILDGKLSLTSEVGNGSIFLVQIPNLHKCKFVVNNKNRLHEKRDLQKYTILIVDDEKINYEYLRTLLSETKAKVLYASDGQQAIDFCRNNSNINLILMDIKMPIIDGYVATQIIKQFRPELAIIAQTAYALESDKIKFIEIGFANYLTKPIYEENFFEMINKYLD